MFYCDNETQSKVEQNDENNNKGTSYQTPATARWRFFTFYFIGMTRNEKYDRLGVDKAQKI